MPFHERFSTSLLNFIFEAFCLFSWSFALWAFVILYSELLWAFPCEFVAFISEDFELFLASLWHFIFEAFEISPRNFSLRAFRIFMPGAFWNFAKRFKAFWNFPWSFFSTNLGISSPEIFELFFELFYFIFRILIEDFSTPIVKTR